MNTQQLIESGVVYLHHPTAFKVFLTLLYMVTVSLIIFIIVMRKRFQKRGSNPGVATTMGAVFTYIIIGFGLLASGVPTPDNAKTVDKFMNELSRKTGYTPLATNDKIQSNFVDNYKNYNGKDEKRDDKNIKNATFKVQVMSSNGDDAYCYLKPAKLTDSGNDDPTNIRMLTYCTSNAKSNK